MKNIKRRNFIKTTSLVSLGLGLSVQSYAAILGKQTKTKTIRVGMIGLDTSHCTAFTKLLNAKNVEPELAGYAVVAAYPWGSRTIESSSSRIPKYIEEVKKMGVKIVDSIADLLKEVDVVLLETNDGNPRLEQALQVIKAGKPIFIDKPVAASFADVYAIYEAAKKYNVPLFSSASLRYLKNAQEIRKGKIGKILGADTYGPSPIEKSHPDLFWYGIHGVELLFTVMGAGCKSVTRTYTKNTDVVVGIWDDGRVGTFRGTRTGKYRYGGTAFGEEDNAEIGPYEGYKSLLIQIVEFFKTGNSPVSPQETLEIYAFMEAADKSKHNKGKSVEMDTVFLEAKKNHNKQ